MGFIATNIAKVPSVGYDWYLFLLTDNWNDPYQEALLNNFDQLSHSVGPDCLVVKGANPNDFYNSLIDTQVGDFIKNNNTPVFPSLVLSSHPPNELDESRQRIDESKVIVLLIPLRMKKDVHDFLRRLSETIKQGDPVSIFTDNAELKWSWITEYLEMKPNFFGLGVNLNPLLDKLFGQKA